MTRHRRLANIGSQPAAAGAIPGRQRLKPGVRQAGEAARLRVRIIAGRLVPALNSRLTPLRRLARKACRPSSGLKSTSQSSCAPPSISKKHLRQYFMLGHAPANQVLFDGLEV